MVIYLSAILYAYKSRLLIIFSWVGVLSFSFLPYLGSSILPETTSFLLVSIWLSIFTRFSKIPQLKSLVFLSFIAGVATGNKLINAFLIIASTCLSLSIINQTYKQKTKALALSLIGSILGFVWLTWPVRSSYLSLFTWATKLFVSSDVHAQGKSTIINPSLYLQSIQSFISTNPLPLLLIFSLLAITTLTVFIKKEKILSPFAITSLVTLGCIAVFFKYTLSYYQLMPYIVVVHLIASRLSNYKPLVFVSILIFVLYGLTPSIKNYLRDTSQAMKQAATLTEFVDNHSSNSTTVWEWGSSRQFALLWGQPYGQAFPPRMVAEISPPFYQIKDNFKKLTQDGIINYEVFSICWQHLYLQQSSLLTFFNQFPDRLFTTVLIPGTNPPMALVESEHCP